MYAQQHRDRSSLLKTARPAVSRSICGFRSVGWPVVQSVGGWVRQPGRQAGRLAGWQTGIQ
eukprot:10942400-Heterocapsa_arctica.AAC.1